MDYFLAHSDDSLLESESLWSIFSSASQIDELEDTADVNPNIMLTARFHDSTGGVDLRVSEGIISLEGDWDTLWNCVMWIKNHYPIPLSLCHPATVNVVDLQDIESVDELLRRMREVWDE